MRALNAQQFYNYPPPPSSSSSASASDVLLVSRSLFTDAISLSLHVTLLIFIGIWITFFSRDRVTSKHLSQPYPLTSS